MSRTWGRAAAVGAVLVVGSWSISAALSAPGWACDAQGTGYDMWPSQSTSLEETMAAVHRHADSVQHDLERETDYVVRQYLLEGEIVQEIHAARTEGRWRIDSVTSC